MAKFSLYKIPLRTLAPGVHTYEYELDRKFFEAIDGEEVKKGNVNVILNVRRTSSSFELNFDIEGVIKVSCTRCLDDMNLDVDTESRLIVKFGSEYSEESDEIVIIPEVEGEINIAWFLYEFIALTIPIKHVHPRGECNRTVSSKFKKHQAVSADDDEDDSDDIIDDDSEPQEDEDTPQTDPRWDTLREINLDDN